ncbi:hypothetical protein H0X06_04770 [Candidatus Dependentiae bacterium]|nr:hypothetical protein [Candidatus Dependentiae bacterium]
MNKSLFLTLTLSCLPFALQAADETTPATASQTTAGQTKENTANTWTGKAPGSNASTSESGVSQAIRAPFTSTESNKAVENAQQSSITSTTAGNRTQETSASSDTTGTTGTTTSTDKTKEAYGSKLGAQGDATADSTGSTNKTDGAQKSSGLAENRSRDSKTWSQSMNDWGNWLRSKFSVGGTKNPSDNTTPLGTDTTAEAQR